MERKTDVTQEDLGNNIFRILKQHTKEQQIEGDIKKQEMVNIQE